MKNVKISKTADLKARAAYRMKFVFGKKVKIGEIYGGCITKTPGIRTQRCETLYYDREKGVLVVYDTIKEQFLFCSGDMAVFNKVIYADSVTVCLGHKEKMFEYIGKYLADKGISSAGENDVFNALRSRFYRVPMGLLGILARCYIAVN